MPEIKIGVPVQVEFWANDLAFPVLEVFDLFQALLGL